MDTNIAADLLEIPSDLRSEIDGEAALENRSALEVLQDAVKRYVREKRWQRTLAAGQARAKVMGFSESDVPRLIAEYRGEEPAQ